MAGWHACMHHQWFIQDNYPRQSNDLKSSLDCLRTIQQPRSWRRWNRFGFTRCNQEHSVRLPKFWIRKSDFIFLRILPERELSRTKCLYRVRWRHESSTDQRWFTLERSWPTFKQEQKTLKHFTWAFLTWWGESLSKKLVFSFHVLRRSTACKFINWTLWVQDVVSG